MKQYNSMYRKEDNIKSSDAEKKVEKKFETVNEDTATVKEEAVVTEKEEPVKKEAQRENKVTYESPKKAVEKSAKVARCEMVNVRKEASTMAPVLEIIDKDATVKTFGVEGQFTKVKTTRGIEGFIMTDYLDEV